MYVFSLALQISGAVLLIIRYWGNTKGRVINEYFPGAGIANNDGNDNAVLEANRVRDCVIEIYANRTAFIYIAVGYALSVFGEKGIGNNIVILLLVIITSAALIFLEHIVAHKLASYLYKENIIIPYDTLPKYIDRTLSTKDIEKMLNDTFKQE